MYVIQCLQVRWNSLVSDRFSIALGRSLLFHNNRDYWKEISMIRSKCRSSSSVVNGYNDSTDILNKFASKYNVL